MKEIANLRVEGGCNEPEYFFRDVISWKLEYDGSSEDEEGSLLYHEVQRMTSWGQGEIP